MGWLVGEAASWNDLHSFERDASDLQAWDPFIITIRRDDGQVAFQRGGGNQRIDIANQTRAMRRSQGTDATPMQGSARSRPSAASCR